MTNDKLLKLIEAIVSYSYSEEVELDVMRNKKVTKREKAMAKNLSDIYRFIHGHSSCYHQNWVDDSEQMYKDFVNQNLL